MINVDKNYSYETANDLLVSSSDLEEIISNCARVIVMHQGTVNGELSGNEITEENIMYLATGVK